ncbi:UDP-N-acetylmuramoyl-L-alanine--D-glutamate ligase [Nocardioides sp. GCM10027113]|uniref:UDP-N-acetylmuramoyl-L-alanine--D-glutamate ligase n=1 Tax=unclassified Nocardioides TaxID=2615069 RepID=UPI00361F1BCC
MRFEDLVGRRVVIWGTGREGRAAHAELERRGIPSLFALTDAVEAPADLIAATAVGAEGLERLANADVVIKSPGVPRTSPDLARVRQLGVSVTSLTDLWLADNAARVVAVTGTKGKSTTSSLIQHLLSSVEVRASLVGNGGTPVTDGDDPGMGVAVAEISSYQAADLSTSPRIAVVTSLYPEHLPWHGGYDQYVEDKLNLVCHQPDLVVVPTVNGEIGQLVRERVADTAQVLAPDAIGIVATSARLTWEGVGELTASQLPIHGTHNHTNAALALTAIAAGFDLPAKKHRVLLDAVRTFGPLAHRLETVPSLDGRQWVDDSLATAPEAVVAALETFPDKRVTLILGGEDRGLDFSPLRTYLRARPPAAIVEVVAVGPAGARWAASESINTTLASDFAEALALARSDREGTDVVLLSPGAPSFDEFASYEQRSASFRAAASAQAMSEKAE